MGFIEQSLKLSHILWLVFTKPAGIKWVVSNNQSPITANRTAVSPLHSGAAIHTGPFSLQLINVPNSNRIKPGKIKIAVFCFVEKLFKAISLRFFQI
jgi:hypothetical protein